jgi:putative toxin-antitoxin system antitoxin component (TIGR02293 family)
VYTIATWPAIGRDTSDPMKSRQTADELLRAGLPESEPLVVVDQLKAGLPSKALDTFKQSARLSDEQLSQLLQVGGRTLSRARGTSRSRLPPDLSERLFAVASVYALAIGVFGDTETAFGWINEPQFGFAGRTPFALISSELGRRQVSSLLQRIEHGMLA